MRIVIIGATGHVGTHLVPRLVDLRKPLIVLVGGATGTGKSSVARILSDHLGVHAYFSADVLRQVQRTVTRSDTHPALHRSSFASEPLLPGFMERIISSVTMRGALRPKT